MSYSFLIEMAWKSALISGAALLLVALLRSRSAADRGAVLRLGVVLLLTLPLIAALFPALVVETAPPPVAAPAAPAETVAAVAPPVLAQAELGAPAGFAPAAAAEPAAGDWNDPGILFLLLYLGGVAMVAGRLLAGLAILGRWTREARSVEAPEWLDALARADTGGREIRLLVSDEAESPLSWGWRRPVILLDRDALRRPEDADAILAHEIAHIVRRDWPSLVASRLTVALFWFNPLVWQLDREVAQQAEEAADSHAAQIVEPARYAQTLLDWARGNGGMVPANAMAGAEPGLSRRVKALLDGRFRRRSGSFWSFAAMAACAAVAAPVAALEFVQAAPEAPEAPEAPPAPLAPSAPGQAEAPLAPAAPAAAPAPLAPLAALAPAAPVPPAAANGAAPPALPRLAAYHPPLPPHPPHAPRAPGAPRELVDADAIAAEVSATVAEALRSAEVARATAHAAVRIDEKAIEEEVRRSVASGLADGARNMRHGAAGMDRGAEEMAREAAKLRDRSYREREIARAAARGDRVTHEDLLEAADDLAQGSREMREAAREMRREADKMRRGG